ncbi:MAG: flagellar hook-associated protein FlgK, partial [Rhodoferax sp.]
MTDIVGISSNAVIAYQRALATTSNNISNVATDGYSRQEVALQSNPVMRLGNLYMGTGVLVDHIKRNYNAFVESNVRNAGSDLASQEPMVTYANRVVDIMGGETMGLTSALDQFFSSARSLSADPASTVLRGSFVRDAQGVASRFHELSGQLDLVQEETTQALKGDVEQINTLTSQLARVNEQLAGQRTETAQPSELLDQRDVLLKSLAGFAHINTRFEANGSVTVSLGPSISKDVVVQGTRSWMVGTEFDPESPEKVNLTLDPYGNPSILSNISSGQLAGLMAFREQVLGSTRSALNNLANAFASEVNSVHQNGVDGYGNTAGALFRFDPSVATAAGGMQVAFDDPLKVAAAAQFRVIEGADNPGNANASLSYENPPAPPPSSPPAIAQALANNDHPSAAKTYTVDKSSPYVGVATVANGMHDVSLFLDRMGAGQQLQVFTRDGRQVLGAALDDTAAAQLLTTDNGFTTGATYSTLYLNQSGADGYKDMSVFYGARADVRLEPMYDSKGAPMAPVPHPAVLQGTRMAMATDTGIAENVLTLNGQALGVLAAPGVGKTLQAGDIANWINTVSEDTGVTASASNEIRVTDSQLKLALPLAINGTVISWPPASGISKDALIDAINAKSSYTGVSARKAEDGTLVLNSLNGIDITISTDTTGVNTLGNALGLSAGTYTGSVSLSRPLATDGSATPIELGFGSSGTPADLAALGFRTGAYIQGGVKDDLLVFVTGAGSAGVSASYAGAPVNGQQALRGQPLVVNFTDATHYTITDSNTNTVVAARVFDPTQLSPGLQYQGLQLSFTSAPKAGDIFTLDGNKDGTGNNENMLALAALEQKPVVGNKTLAVAYLDHVNEMGNVARQATIAQTALKVVNDQATAARDAIAGVNLDQEAADLIRFQQAY